MSAGSVGLFILEGTLRVQSLKVLVENFCASRLVRLCVIAAETDQPHTPDAARQPALTQASRTDEQAYADSAVHAPGSVSSLVAPRARFERATYCLGGS